MRLEIFQDNLYIDRLNNFGLNIELNPKFSLENMELDSNSIISSNSTISNLYKFLSNLNFIYYFEQIYIAHTTINNRDYIIKIDDEMTISIIGNNEYNWLYLILDDSDYVDFETFCLATYLITPKELDYDEFNNLSEKYLNFGQQ